MNNSLAVGRVPAIVDIGKRGLRLIIFCFSHNEHPSSLGQKKTPMESSPRADSWINSNHPEMDGTRGSRRHPGGQYRLLPSSAFRGKDANFKDKAIKLVRHAMPSKRRYVPSGENGRLTHFPEVCRKKGSQFL